MPTQDKPRAGEPTQRITKDSLWSCPLCGSEYSGADNPQMARGIRDRSPLYEAAAETKAQRDELLAAVKRYQGRAKAIVLTGDNSAWREVDKELSAAIARAEGREIK